MQHGGLHGKTAIVTGATRGIGRAIVERFVADGAKVVALARHMDRLKQLQSDLGDSVFIHTLDLADDEASAAVPQTVIDRWGPIDILVNNAGIMERSFVADLDIGEVERTMKINFINQVRFTQVVYRHMRERRYGKIVNMSSLSGKRGYAGGTSYCSSKFALIGFTQSLAVEAIEYGINVNAVCPSFVETEMGLHAIQVRAEQAGISLDEMRAQVESRIPAGRIGRVEDVAALVRFLVSDESNYIVGQALNVDGGQLFY